MAARPDAQSTVADTQPPELGIAAAGRTGPDVDSPIIDAIRAGDESAFGALLDRYHGSLVRLAATYVTDRAVAEEVAQETWIGVFTGIGRFEGRSSFKTWLFGILVNQARRRGARERRSVSFTALGRDDDRSPAVSPDRFLPPGAEDAGWWATYPQRWSDTPEAVLLSAEVRAEVDRAISALPPGQMQVVVLRDVEGCGAAEVCGMLGLSPANQRVLLHRGRSKVRLALERYLEGS